MPVDQTSQYINASSFSGYSALDGGNPDLMRFTFSWKQLFG
jgi:hypothetical protein